MNGQKIPISEDEEGRKNLTRLVTTCYHALQQYGKTPEELQAVVALMQIMLEGYSYKKIRAAFTKYLETGKTVPTPADILEIIKIPDEDDIKISQIKTAIWKKKHNLTLGSLELKALQEFENEIYQKSTS